MRARPLAPVAVGACLLLGLTGCEKPTPGVTVSSGTKSVHVESATYCRDGQSPEKQNCVEHLDRSALLRVKAGNEIGFDVDKSIAEHGWIIVLPTLKQQSDIQDTHHLSLPLQFTNGPILDVEVRSLDKVSKDAKVTGVWRIRLVQD
jgi:hypothetical protein